MTGDADGDPRAEASSGWIDRTAHVRRRREDPDAPRRSSGAPARPDAAVPAARAVRAADAERGSDGDRASGAVRATGALRASGADRASGAGRAAGADRASGAGSRTNAERASADESRASAEAARGAERSPRRRVDEALDAIGRFVREQRVATLALVGAVVFAVLAVGAVALGGATATGAQAHPPASAAPRSTPTGAPRAQPAQTGAGESIRTCSIRTQAGDPWLGSLQARIVDATSGEVRFERGGGTAGPFGAGQRVLTAAAALAVLGPDARATTTVVKGAAPGSVVLVGGGDLTLSRTRTGDETVYPGAAHLDALAEQVRAAWYADPANGPLRTLVLDAGRFGDEDWNSDWPPDARGEGVMPRLAALEVDGDRDDPTAAGSPRGDDPVQRAGSAFAQLLGVHDVQRGTAPDGAAILGSADSAPVGQLVGTMLRTGDAALAEMLARLTALRAGAGAGFDDVQAGIAAGLAEYGIPADGLAVVDGSGLSTRNAVPPSILTSVLAAVQAKQGDLGALADALPVSQQRESPVLRDRFTGTAALDPGAVHAVPGADRGLATLTGLVTADDGTSLAVAVAARGDVDADAVGALDALVAAAARCGDNLAG